MQQYDGYEMPYQMSAAEAAASERSLFVRRVYTHVAGAVLALIAIEAVLLSVVDPRLVLNTMFAGKFSWLIVLLAFMGASFLARMWAQSQSSRVMQYMGLSLYVVAEAVILLPLLIVAQFFQERVQPGSNVIAQAGLLTFMVFVGLTLSVFTLKKDFSFLGPVITIGSLIALGVIVAGILFGFTLGLFFSFAMVALLSAAILYQTSAVMLHYPTDMYVAASLELFASIATLFWYILQILMSLNGRD
ncbi:MAG: Bax inhibitor-1 family protein [Gemmataceae bacterium]